MGLSYAVLKLCFLDATPDSERPLSGKPFWLALISKTALILRYRAAFTYNE